VKRRNFEEPEEPMAVGQSRARKARKSKHIGRARLRKKSPKSRELRPQRRAARNALSLFSKITGASSDAEEDEDDGEEDSESSYSESDSMIPELKEKESPNSSILDDELKKHLHVQERESYTQNGSKTSQTGRRLVLKLPNRNLNVVNALEPVKAESLKHDMASASAGTMEPQLEAQLEPREESKTELVPELESKPELELNDDEVSTTEADPQIGRLSLGTEHEEAETSIVANSSKIRWGKVNQRSSKRPKVTEDSEPPDQNNPLPDAITSMNVEESRRINGNMESNAVLHSEMTIGAKQQAGSSSQPIIYKRLKVKARGLGNDMSRIEDEVASAQHATEDINRHNRFSEETGAGADSKPPVVYTRFRPSKKRKPDDNEYDIEESTSNSNHSRDDEDYDAGADEGSHHRTRLRERSSRSRHNNTYCEASTSGRRSHLERKVQMGSNYWASPSKSGINLRPSRNRREVSGYIERRQYDSNQLGRKLSWLMLLEHEESYRYIPQQGDEVVYLRQVPKFIIKHSLNSML
jgi:PH-interacting protein